MTEHLPDLYTDYPGRPESDTLASAHGKTLIITDVTIIQGKKYKVVKLTTTGGEVYRSTSSVVLEQAEEIRRMLTHGKPVRVKVNCEGDFHTLEAPT